MTKLKIVLLLISGLVLRLAVSNISLSEQRAKENIILRSKVITTYQSVLPLGSANLLGGIVLGSRDLDTNFRHKLSSVGLSHVVAASGMNVTLVYAFVFWLLGFVSFNKWFKNGLILATVFFYATLTGFDPPIVRAVLMTVFSTIAIVLGRQSSSWVGLAVSAYLMLWVSPALIINPSFLLSFTAMSGQIFLSTIKINLPNPLTFFMQFFSQSLTAIIFTFPIVIIFFSKLNLASILVNVIVLWTIEPLMVLGGVIGTAGLIFTPFARALALPAQGLLEYFLWVVNFFSEHQFFTISLSFSNTISKISFTLGYYFLLSSVLLYRQFYGQNRRST